LIAPAFLEKLVQRAQGIKVDDALAPGARLGPLVRFFSRQVIEASCLDTALVPSARLGLLLCYSDDRQAWWPII